LDIIYRTELKIVVSMAGCISQQCETSSTKQVNSRLQRCCSAQIL